MGRIFSPPSPPPMPAMPQPAAAAAPVPEAKPPEPLPPAPERSSEDVMRAAENQRRAYQTRSRGRASTMLTGGLGVSEGSTSSAVRMLGSVGV